MLASLADKLVYVHVGAYVPRVGAVIVTPLLVTVCVQVLSSIATVGGVAGGKGFKPSLGVVSSDVISSSAGFGLGSGVGVGVGVGAGTS